MGLPKVELQRREIPLVGQNNFRDLGGYRAADGRGVKWGQLYRSGELSELEDDDVERLTELGIRSVVDLRSQTEMDSKGKDRAGISAAVLLSALGVPWKGVVEDTCSPTLSEARARARARG
jgi:protein tyrosine/serine phosphatase